MDEEIKDISAFGIARSTVPGAPLDENLLHSIDAFWRACNYLALGMLYLTDNPLLQTPLLPIHIKNRLLGHFGTSPGLAFIYTHLNRIIKNHQQPILFLAGPGHGAPGVLGPLFLEGSYTDFYPDKSQTINGMKAFFKQFSFPGGIGSHCTPETPGSIHEGGELGYVLSHACGAAFDNPQLIVAAIVGDGEAETGPLATSWHVNKFLNPIRDGAVLPILHLNGYKINNPTLLARIPHEELNKLISGYGWKPYFVEGSDNQTMHQAMAATLDMCMADIRNIQKDANSADSKSRPIWPMIVLRTPKGWTSPAEIDGHKIEGSWRSHQVPLVSVKNNPEHLKLLEDWMHSYKPEELFTNDGALRPELQELVPKGQLRMGSTPFANGGTLKKALQLPDFKKYGIQIEKPAQERHENTKPLGIFLRDIMRMNMTNFRVFGPDETTSNKLSAIYESSKKFWIEEYLPEDADGCELDKEGRVMEMLSEHTLEGMLEGYLLTGRHGFISTYEAFVHIIDSMCSQHAKWLDISNRISWRQKIASLNMLITSTVWRQDHNGFTHQDPGFLDLIMNKSPEVIRVYLPPDVNCLISVADHCLKSQNNINVIVCDKQNHLQYLNMDDAIRHCTKGIGIWEWASTDLKSEPDIVIASAGDVPTQEALAATALVREEFPELKIRFVNVVDLYKMQPRSEHPHGLTDKEFDSLFTTDKPVIFNFHGYPWLIHRLSYKRTNHDNIHVRGYKEKGSINTPFELAIQNEVDRFSLAIDMIDRIPKIQQIGAHVREKFINARIYHLNYAYEHGIDPPEITNWKWPFSHHS